MAFPTDEIGGQAIEAAISIQCNRQSDSFLVISAAPASHRAALRLVSLRE
jgi:hypothetical protein